MNTQDDHDILSLKVGPEALIAMNDAQRVRAVQLWELGKGIRIWKNDNIIRYELGDGRFGVLFSDGGNADGVNTNTKDME